MTRDILCLRLDAPLMSFGGARIDGQPSAYPVPTRAMIAGLLGNALGLRRTQTDRLQALQDALRIAVGVVRPGRVIRDHVATDLGRPHMRGPMWTTQGKPVTREGSAATDIRLEQRPYVADADLLCAIDVAGENAPDPATLHAAIQEPARPLFIGRAGCPPTDVFDCRPMPANGLEQALNLLAAEHGVELAHVHLPADRTERRQGDRTEVVMGVKDWALGVHAGQEVRVVRPPQGEEAP